MLLHYSCSRGGPWRVCTYPRLLWIRAAYMYNHAYTMEQPGEAEPRCPRLGWGPTAPTPRPALRTGSWGRGGQFAARMSFLALPAQALFNLLKFRDLFSEGDLSAGRCVAPGGTLSFSRGWTGTRSGLQPVPCFWATSSLPSSPVTRDKPPGAATQILLCSLRYRLMGRVFYQ